MRTRRGVVAGLLVGLVLVVGCGKTRTQEGEPPAPPSPGQTEWMRQLGGNGRERVVAVAVDPDGNVVLGGQYEGESHFGGEPLPNHGRGGTRGEFDEDAVVAKYSPSGEHLWSLGFGGVSRSAWVEVLALQGREVLVLGESLGGLQLEGGNVPTGDFLLRLDPEGRLLHAVALEVPAEHLVVEPSGDLLVVAREALGTDGRTTLHLARLDPLGAPRWRREFTAEGWTFVWGLEQDSSGNLYMAGRYQGVLRLGPLSVPAGPGAFQPFVAKLSADGEALWVRGFSPPPGGGSGSSASVLGLAVGRDGQVFVSGSFHEGLEIDGHVSTASSAGFLAALDEGDGKARWVQWFSADNFATLYAVRVDAEGAVLVSGTFQGTMLVGGLPLTNDHEAHAAALVAKYRPSGEHVWSRVLSDERGVGLNMGAMACAPSGRVVLPTSILRDGRDYDVMLWSLWP